MTTYIIDASVVIERLVRGTFTPNAQALFRQALLGDQLIVPEFCLMECTNVIWKHVRFHGMSRPDARLTLRNLRALPLKRVPTKQILNRALEIGLDHSLAIYDSVYIALALKTLNPLITIDQPQERAAFAESVVVKPVTNFKP